MTYSELASFMDCGTAFRLRELIGFQPRLATELGYGKAVHHIMRAVAEATKATGQVPSAQEIEKILEQSFFLPTANKVEHRQMRDAAQRLVATYTIQHSADLHRVWEVERPFELHFGGLIVSGRADVILDREGGNANSLAIVDYKTSTVPGRTTRCGSRSTPTPDAARDWTCAPPSSTTSRTLSGSPSPSTPRPLPEPRRP
jgi:DNA helicase-2/ATP-dependent DNA helicase PcrA